VFVFLALISLDAAWVLQYGSALVVESRPAGIAPAQPER
jgi:hypothetical protein